MPPRRRVRRSPPALWIPVAFAALLAGCAADPARTIYLGSPVVISGKVTCRGIPVPDASVTLADRYTAAEKRIVQRARTERDGAFRAELPPGTYFVEAEGVADGKPVFAFSGQNPVRIRSGTRSVSLKAVPRTAIEVFPGSPDRGAVLEGEVIFAGKPVEDAVVQVYATPESLFKGMGVAMSPPTGPDGKFTVENLGESLYYIVVRRRGEAGTAGPLGAGELYGFFPGNPVRLMDRTVTRIRIEPVEKEKPSPESH